MRLGKCFLCGSEFIDKNYREMFIKQNCTYKYWFDIDMVEKIKLISEYEEKNDCSFRMLLYSSIIIYFFVLFIFLIVSIVAVIGVIFAHFSVMYDNVCFDVIFTLLLCFFCLIVIFGIILIVIFLNKRAKRSEKINWWKVNHNRNFEKWLMISKNIIK